MATLKDVAKECGLTVSTVSRVLNNRGYISEDARRKVADAMKKLNYHPNELARSLQNKKSNIIGLLVPHVEHPYFAQMISVLERTAYERGYRMFLFNTMGRGDKTDEYLNLCSASRVEGIILCSGDISEESLEYLTVPMVALERPLNHCAASVICDNTGGALMAAKHLMELGCRHLLYVGSGSELEMPAEDRASSFLRSCEEADIPCDAVYTNTLLFRQMSYYEAINEAFERNEAIDGVFCSSDIIAAQVLQICHNRGIKVPEQVKVIGFDDVDVASFTTPRLTTIHQPIREMAELAVDLLVRAIEGETDISGKTFPVTLIQRESTIGQKAVPSVERTE